MPIERDLAWLRANGWSVAVHNDYRLASEPHTFWLFTHPRGRWVKGEGPDDAGALAACRRQVENLQNEPSDTPPQLIGNWAHDALVLIDQAESLIRFGSVNAPKERYTPASEAFWKVVSLLQAERQRLGTGGRLKGEAP